MKVLDLFNIFPSSTHTLVFMEYSSSYEVFKVYSPLGAGSSLNICSVKIFSFVMCFKFIERPNLLLPL
jgi:hypothetical protein